MVKAKSWVMTKYFDGFPKKSDFGLKVEELPEPKDGGKASLFLLFTYGLSRNARSLVFLKN